MTRCVIFVLIAFALVLFIADVRTQEVGFCWRERTDDESEFDYGDGPNGPTRWGEHDGWWACGNGTEQSPIDVESNAAHCPELGRLGRNYKIADATLVNRGHDIMVNWTEDAGSLEIKVERCSPVNQCDWYTKSFTLYQCHWHHPAEHTLDGVQYPLEIHLVHKAEDGEIAVIGILYKSGARDPFLDKLTDAIHALANNPNETVELLGPVDPFDIKLDSSKYYRYMGSLTTPACTEGVIWTVIDEIKTVLDDQVSALQAAVHDGYGENARPRQPLNERKVSMYSEEAQWSST